MEGKILLWTVLPNTTGHTQAEVSRVCQWAWRSHQSRCRCVLAITAGRGTDVSITSRVVSGMAPMNQLPGNPLHHRVVAILPIRRPVDRLKSEGGRETETGTATSPTETVSQSVVKGETRAETSSSRLLLAAQGLLDQLDRGQTAIWERGAPNRPPTAPVIRVDVLCLFLRPVEYMVHHFGHYRGSVTRN